MDKIKLKEKEYKVIYNMGAIKVLQKQMAPDNKNVMNMLPIYKKLTAPSIEDIYLVIYAGILGGGADISMEEVEKVLDFMMPKDLNPLIIEVTEIFFRTTMGDEAYKELKNLKAPKAKKKVTAKIPKEKK